MDLNLVLWLGGMFFSLAVFVVKVGCGLGWARMRWPFVLLTLVLYLGLFLLAAVFGGGLIKVLEPVVQQGPWLHAFMALGMMAWGFYILARSPAAHCHGPQCQLASEGGGHHQGCRQTGLLLLIMPCPVCLTAIIFSTWAALQVFQWPSWLVGLGLGLTFVGLTLTTCFFFRVFQRRATTVARNYGLALSLLGIGAYFWASIFLPSRIEAAKSIYQSFATENGGPGWHDQLGVLAILLVTLLFGFVSRRKWGVNK